MDKEMYTRLLEGAKAGEPVRLGRFTRVHGTTIRRLFAENSGTLQSVSITGASVEGMLDLADLDLKAPLIFEDCIFNGQVVLVRTKAPVISLSKSTFTEQIVASGADIGHTFFMRDSVLHGHLNLTRAKIGGNLDLMGTRIVSAGNNASISADNVTVGGNIFFRHSETRAFEATGGVFLRGASIGGDLDCEGGRFLGSLNASTSTITHGLIMRDGFRTHGMLDLNHASAKVLADEEACWPAKGNLNICHFRYESIDPGSPLGGMARKRWIELQPHGDHFEVQPYEHLANLFKENGDGGRSRLIQIAKEDARRERGDMNWLHRAIWYLYGVLSGYGYRAFRPLKVMALMIGIGTIVFWVAYANDAMQPIKGRQVTGFELSPKEVANHKSYPSFCPLAYSSDLFLPFIDMKQEEYWFPQAAKDSPWLNKFLVGYMWLHMTVGWALSALFVAGMTGLIKRE